MREGRDVKYWFDREEIVDQLPILQRLYARYLRFFTDRSTGIAQGGSFLLRRMVALTRVLSRNPEASLRIDGRTILLDLLDMRMITAISEIADERPEFAVMSRTISPGDTFLDVGANYGAYSIMAAQCIGRNGRIIAFEPQPRLASFLRRSFDVNHIHNGSVYEMALGERSCTASLFIPESNSGSATLYRPFLGSGRCSEVTVQCGSLDDTVDWKGLPGKAFIKLDVEGGELSFLRGAVRMIAERRPTILIEINPASARAAGYRTEDLIAFLVRLGYEDFAAPETFPSLIHASRVQCDRQQNIVAIPKSTRTGVLPA